MQRMPSNKWAAAVVAGVVVVSGTAPMLAQGRSEIQALIKQLAPDAQPVLNRLAELNELKAEDWRYHVGDLAHGEALDLDDASWETKRAGSEAPKDAVWYRSVITVPKLIHGYDPTGASIWFSFDASSREDVPEIIYVNGKRVALGADLEPISLTENAKPGERFVVAVKLLATSQSKKFGGAELRVDYAQNRPNPQDLGSEILSAAALIPALSKNPAADKAVLTKSVALIDLHALDAGDQQKFDASLQAAEHAMDALRPMMQQATFHESGNAHIDAAWLWPRTETVDVVHRTFGTAAQLMQEYPKYTYTQSAAQYYEWMADKYPELADQIKQYVKQGRWEAVGGMWVEPDLNLPGGESTVRSILLGKRYLMKEFGVDVTIGWNPDTFGYNWQLPQIYARSGINTFATQKMEWNETNQLPFKLFWWESRMEAKC